MSSSVQNTINKPLVELYDPAVTSVSLYAFLLCVAESSRITLWAPTNIDRAHPGLVPCLIDVIRLV